MSRLFLWLLMLSTFTLAGIGIIAMLTMGYYDWPAILGSAAIGAIAGIPIAWLIARRIQATDPHDSL